MLHWFALFAVLPIWFARWYFRRLKWWGFFVSSNFVSFSLCQSDHRKKFIKKLLSNSECGISKTKDKCFTTMVIISLQMISDGQSCLNEPTAKSCIYDLLLPPGIKGLGNLFFDKVKISSCIMHTYGCALDAIYVSGFSLKI